MVLVLTLIWGYQTYHFVACLIWGQIWTTLKALYLKFSSLLVKGSQTPEIDIFHSWQFEGV